jgi:GTP-binding protein
MKIQSATFVRSAVDKTGWPKDARPQVAFVGRSNVGKSSLINNLLNRKGLVKTSSKPGKTREINFFDINGSFYFVDLPGFGYARAPGRVQRSWGPMIETYLTECEDLKLVVFLIDIRHDPGENDRSMQVWLNESGLPVQHVITKADKVVRGNRQKHLKLIADGLQLDRATMIEYSATTGEGKPRLWEAIRLAVTLG